MFSVIVIAFLLIHLAPGDPVARFISQQGTTPEYIERMRALMGLDKPLHEQFFIYLSKVLQGDFGYSLALGSPALIAVLERLPRTLLLMVFAIGVAFVAGIFLGVESARRPNTKWDYLITTVSLGGYSVPVFWVGLIFILIFGVILRWFPTIGMYTLGTTPTGISGALDVLNHLILPGMALAVTQIALISRLTRQGTLEAFNENYILTARMKGLPERTIAYRHAFRNALLPAVTILGMSFGYFISWSVLIEIVFSWPGLGMLLWLSIVRLDYPVLMSLFIVISVMVIVGNLLADIGYALLDPRITHE